MLLRENEFDDSGGRAELAQLVGSRFAPQELDRALIVPAGVRVAVRRQLDQRQQRAATVFIHRPKCTMRADLRCRFQNPFSARAASALIPRDGGAAPTADTTSCAPARTRRHAATWRRRSASSSSGPARPAAPVK